MGDQLLDLEADMLLSGGEGTVPLATVLCWHPRWLMDAANVEDRPEGALLLILIRNPGSERLKRCAIGLADFQIVPGHLIVTANHDRVPWAVVLLAHCPSAALID
ncbi:hypothetical protein [Aminobacter niigataensis]|uniref:hypothetical protein n=1 Tax=Aminobacter niigataensis TaxID=83265 RepID=UPI0024C64E56|nr:hypothetical protein [Aminobacter niigataensis]CAI2936252.1 protein of unknown function [Aminobacter niigataensis]